MEGAQGGASAAQRTPQAKLPQIDPFTSPESVVQALQTNDPQLLSAGKPPPFLPLVKIDKRAAALNAKPAPRGSPDLLLDYLKRYPGCEGVFSAWDLANKTNNSPLSTFVLSCLTSLIRLLSTDPFTPAPELIKTLLSAKYTPYLERALNPGRNDVTTAALKLCNVLVGFGGGRFARRLFGVFGWSPKITTRLYKTRLRTTTSSSVLHKPDIRTLLVLLVLGFLSASDVRLKTQVLETKGLLSGAFKGLNEDPEVVVNLVLETVHRELVCERRVGLEARRNVFDEGCINELVKLYNYPLPSSDDETIPASHPSLSIHRFLHALSDWLADQIASSPVGRSSGPQKVLGLLLKSLKVTEERDQRELGLYILGKAPVLAGAFWSKFPSSLDPRLSSRWISAITFATQVVCLPVSGNLSLPPSSSSSSTMTTTFAPPSVTSILDTILPPSPPSSSTLNRAWYTKSLSHETPLVSFLSSIFLLAILQKAAKALEAMAETSSALEEGENGRWVLAARRVREELRARVPDPTIVVALMTKTAAAAAGIPAAAKKEKAKKAEAEVETTKPPTTTADQSAALLRTNIALRLLFLYHRVAPSLIATLKFDFARLPQVYAKQPQAVEGGVEKAEGLRAMSSAYALRLAAVHETGVGWNRPGDHFKSTLSPLFQLYRTPSTPSNRSLLLSILKRQLSTSLLFADDLDEVDVWLGALPVSTEQKKEEEAEAMDFFEKVVQKTLTSPLKLANSADDATEAPKLGPLSCNVLAALSASSSRPTDAILALVQNVFLAFLAHSTSLSAPRALLSGLKVAWAELGKEDKPTKRALKWVEECVEVAEGNEEEAKREKKLVERLQAKEGRDLEEEVRALGPVRANVFASLLPEEPELLGRALAAMPLPLICLHIGTTSDLSHLLPLLPLFPASSFLAAAQILLYRYIASPLTALAESLVKLYRACGNEVTRRAVRERVSGQHGLLGAFAGQESEAAASITTQLVAELFDPARPSDRLLVQPFCEVVSGDLDGVKQAASLPPRVRGSASLLPFFDPASALPFVDAILSRTSPSQASAKDLLIVAFERVLSLPPSPAFDAFWIAQFSRLNRLAAEEGIEAAGKLLAKGAEALMPTTRSSTLQHLGAAKASPWHSHAAEWASELLAGQTLTKEQATVLSALVYRSAAARASFVAWLKTQFKVDPAAPVEGLGAPLKALLEITEVKKASLQLPEELAPAVVRTALASPGLDTDQIRTLELLCASASEAIKTAFDQHLTATGRDDVTATSVRLLSALAAKDPSLLATLEACVHASFEGLVRRFAMDEADGELVKALISALHDAVVRHKMTLKGHLLEPLVTAITTRRLDQPDATALATALCRQHRFKDNEVTRHLNEVFASSHFRNFSTSTTTDAAASSAIELVLALALQSPFAAANARTADQLIPFYRGTLSSTDRALLDLFQRIELVSGSSLSPSLKAWNPSTDSTTLLDGSRIGALGATQKPFVRRSWLRAFASSRLEYSTDDDSKTYDPRFLIGFVLGLVEEDELKVQEWTILLESGVLGTVVAALAASAPSLRAMARATLATTLKKIEPLAFREKDELQLVLTHCRNALFSPEGEPIPSTIALFLAHCVSLLGAPESPLYPPFTRFLLQRPVIDMRDVPMFYMMMYSSNSDEFAAAPREERAWMVRYLTEGLVRTQDWKIYRRRQVFELLASLFQTSRQDAPLRKLILQDLPEQFLLRATTIPTAAPQTPVDIAERRLLIAILDNLVKVMAFDKLTGVADVLDAVTMVVGSDVASLDLNALLSLLHFIISRLPLPPLSPTGAPSPTLTLILTRLPSLISSISSSLPSPGPQALAARFYTTSMALAFVQFEAGAKESLRDREVWCRAVERGLEAGVEMLRREMLLRVCE
ncbi:SPOSA6832_02649, partial [Sporobolomyces salmonicolor]